MSSGQKRMVTNTRERAVSNDLNRSRDFGAAYLADVLHHLFDPFPPFPELGNGAALLTDDAGPIATPIDGVVLDGLMVIVPIGGTELIVNPGAALLVDIDGLTGSPVLTPHSDDDSVAKVVVDPVGVTLGSGTLIMTANASGSTRVDVVEVRRMPALVLETDNRDVFDPSTGLFTPTLVNKVLTARLEYRIRLGVPGAGLPANAQGWMPIAVASVPNGAATWDTCIFYDVRPLARDRVNPFTRGYKEMPDERVDLFTDVRTSAGERRLSGIANLEDPQGYRGGGQLRWRHLGADVQWIDIQDATVLEPGFAAGANVPFYLWLAYPGSLPRFVRYTTTVLAPFPGRGPFGHYGIPVISTTAPGGESNTAPTTGLAMPSSSGLTGATTTVAKCLAALAHDASSNRAPVLIRDRRTQFMFDATLASNGTPNISKVPDSSTATEDRYFLTFGTHIPRNAKRLLIQCRTRFSGAAGAAFNFIFALVALDPLVTTWDQAIFSESVTENAIFDAGGLYTAAVQRWIDLPVLLPAGNPAYGGVTLQRIRATWAQTGAATKDVAQSLIMVMGWEI